MERLNIKRQIFAIGERNMNIKLWRKLLPVIFVIVLLHLMKDITQDILKISTPLDLLGNINEDFSMFSKPGKYIYLYGLGGLSVISELFIVVTTPIILKRNFFGKIEKWNLAATLYLILFFGLAILLDPKF